jgi:hypothetical protein
MVKLKLVDWDILNRVYYGLYQRQDNYRVITTNINDILDKLTITNENGDKLFSIDKNLNIEAHDSKTTEQIAKCFTENGIHAS